MGIYSPSSVNHVSCNSSSAVGLSLGSHFMIRQTKSLSSAAISVFGACANGLLSVTACVICASTPSTFSLAKSTYDVGKLPKRRTCIFNISDGISALSSGSCRGLKMCHVPPYKRLINCTPS